MLLWRQIHFDINQRRSLEEMFKRLCDCDILYSPITNTEKLIHLFLIWWGSEIVNFLLSKRHFHSHLRIRCLVAVQEITVTCEIVFITTTTFEWPYHLYCLSEIATVFSDSLGHVNGVEFWINCWGFLTTKWLLTKFYAKN